MRVCVFEALTYLAHVYIHDRLTVWRVCVFKKTYLKHIYERLTVWRVCVFKKTYLKHIYMTGLLCVRVCV